MTVTCFLLLTLLASFVMSASPGRTLVDVRPDRTTTRFHVFLHLSCHEDWNFDADVQLWEHNSLLDEKISELVTVHHNEKTPKYIEVKGEMYNIDESGEEFEPYLYFTYQCGSETWKKARFSLPYCFKEQKFCDYDLGLDLWNLPYQPSDPLQAIGQVFADSGNDEKLSAMPYA